MRPPKKDSVLTFRAGFLLKDGIERHCREEQILLSTFLREAVAEALRRATQDDRGNLEQGDFS